MTGDAIFFTNVVLCDRHEDYVAYLIKNDFDQVGAERSTLELREMSGAVAVTITWSTIEIIRRHKDIAHREKNYVTIGGHVVVVNFFGLSPEELFAVTAHEFGHVTCGHIRDDQDSLQKELEADRMAACLAGPDLMRSSLIKLRDRLMNDYDDAIGPGRLMAINKRIGALTF